MSRDASTEGTLNLKRDQEIVFAALKDAELPAELASAVGRGQRLLTHLKNLGWAGEVTQELEARVSSCLSRLERDGWDEAVSEALASDAAEWVLDATSDEDVEGLEVLTHLVVLDDHLCTLRTLGLEGEREMTIESVRYAVTARLDVCAAISTQARRFVERHGPQDAWGEMWREIAQASEALTAHEATFEEGLDARLLKTKIKNAAGALELPEHIKAVLG